MLMCTDSWQDGYLLTQIKPSCKFWKVAFLLTVKMASFQNWLCCDFWKVAFLLTFKTAIIFRISRLIVIFLQPVAIKHDKLRTIRIFSAVVKPLTAFAWFQSFFNHNWMCRPFLNVSVETISIYKAYLSYMLCFYIFWGQIHTRPPLE